MPKEGTAFFVPFSTIILYFSIMQKRWLFEEEYDEAVADLLREEVQVRSNNSQAAFSKGRFFF